MKNLVSVLKENKPNLSVSSARTYASNLGSVFKQLEIDESVTKESILKHFKSIHRVMTSMPLKRRKTLASALIAMVDEGKKTDELNELKDMVAKDSKKDKAEEEKQELTAGQKKSWLSWSEIEEKAQEIEDKLPKDAWEKPEKYYKQLEDYIMAMLYVLNPPRRALDYAVLYWAPSKAHNWIDFRKQQFVFNVYKTAKKHAEQRVKINEKLLELLKKWRSVNNCNTVLCSSKGEQMTSSQITKRLANIFDKPGFGVNILRHAFVSDVLKGMPFLDSLKNIATSLGHTPGETILYKKHN